MPGWLHGVCICCDNDPNPPPPPPFCPNACGVSGQVNHLIVGVAFTPCPPRSCQSVSSAPCPALISCIETHHAVSIGTHIVPANQCPNGAAGACGYFKPLALVSEQSQGWQDACAGQTNSGQFTCPVATGTKPCSTSPDSERAIAYITGSFGFNTLDVGVWDFSSYSCPARCPQAGCGTCIDIETRQIGSISITGAELTQFCAGQTITRIINQAQACSPNGNPTCTPAFPGRYFTGQLTLTLTRGS